MFSKVMLLLWILKSSIAVAAPKMDVGVGTSLPLMATVVPDHETPNLYYVFPQSSDMVVRQDGRYEFLYIENWSKRPLRRSKIQQAEARMWVRPSIESPALKQKIAEIMASNPSAKFSVVTAFKTEVTSSDREESYFLNTDCTQVSGPLEIPVYCRLEINPRLASGFKTLVRNSQARVFHYLYYFYGYANGNLREFKFAVPLKMGSLHGSGYFVDQYGDELDSPSAVTSVWPQSGQHQL